MQEIEEDGSNGEKSRGRGQKNVPEGCGWWRRLDLDDGNRYRLGIKRRNDWMSRAMTASRNIAKGNGACFARVRRWLSRAWEMVAFCALCRTFYIEPA